MTAVAIGILSYNGRAYLRPCLASVLAQTLAPAEIVVLDNASADGSADLVADHFPTVRLIRNPTNLGVAGGLNALVQATSAPLIVLLNQDVELRPGCLAALVESLSADHVGVVGAKLLFPDGVTVQHAGGYLEWPRYLAQHHGFRQPDDGRWDQPRPLDYVTGAVFAIRRAVWDTLNGFDTRFSPAYFEETDFCLRARDAGWRVVYQPAASAIHHESTTLGRESRAYLGHYHRGRLLLALRHASLHHLLVAFARAEAQVVAALRAATADAHAVDEVAALSAAYAYAIENLSTALHGRRDTPLSPGSRWAITDMLTGLRRLAETSQTAEDWRHMVLPTPATVGLRDKILEAEQKQTVREVPFISRTPMIGPAIVALRNAWNWMSTKWYVRPLLEQQNQFNTTLSASLRVVLAELEAAHWKRDAEWLAELRDNLRVAEEAILNTNRQTADLTRRLTALEDRTLQVTRPSSGKSLSARRLRLAYFSPFSPQHTGIAAYSDALAPALAQHADVEIFTADITPTDPAIQQMPVFPYRDYPVRRQTQPFDATIYQMGNHYAYHGPIYAMLRRYPGILVLHELVMRHFIAGATLDQGRPAEYEWEVGYAAGIQGLRQARAITRRGGAPLSLDYPLIEHMLDLSQAVLCHSEYVARHVKTLRPELPIGVVGQAIAIHATAIPAPADRPFTVITAGYLTPAKGLAPALEGFARFATTHPQARYILVGDIEPGFDLVGLINRFELTDQVHRRGYVDSLVDFDNALAEADVCLNLRYPTNGETSASLLHAMGVGIPTIINDGGWFSETPDNACIKLPSPPTAQAVAESLDRLASDPGLRNRMGQTARRWVQATHTPTKTAEDYLSFIKPLLDLT